jgi:hypothetical protein
VRCASSSTLTRYVALDTKFVEATRQEYVLFLRPANGKTAFIRIAGDLAQGQAQFIANHSDGRRPTSEADPDSNSWLSRRGLRAGMKRWRNGLAVASVIWLLYAHFRSHA